MEIKVEKLNRGELDKKGVFRWPVWKKEISQFDWYYNDIEECYFLEGEVMVETKKGERISFGKGDFVTFPKGMFCGWTVKKPVKKHYNFR